MFRFKVFQYKNSDRMSHLEALYDNFEIFRKKNFNGKEFSKTVLNSQYVGESIFNQSGRVVLKVSPLPTLEGMMYISHVIH